MAISWGKLSDFNNFWYQNSSHNLTSQDSLVVHLTKLMCLHYLVKLIARVLSPYITYFSIQVVDFWHQIFTNFSKTVFNSQQLFSSCLLIYIIYSLPVMTSMWQYSDISSSSRRAHRARETVELLKEVTPDFIQPSLWSPNSPDLNPSTMRWNHAGEGLQQGEDCKCWRTSPAHRGRVGTSWSALYRRRGEGVAKTTASVCCFWRRTV